MLTHFVTINQRNQSMEDEDEDGYPDCTGSNNVRYQKDS